MTQTSTPAPNPSLKTLGQPLILYENWVELTMENGVSKAISMQNFFDILTTALSTTAKTTMSDYILPANCYLFSISGTEMKVSCYYPAKAREIKYISGQSTKPTEMTIALPNIIIAHTLKKREPGWQLVSTLYLCTDLGVNGIPTKHMVGPSKKDRIWNLPLPNMYGDGRMCFGQNTLLVNFTDNLRGLDWYFKVLYESPFNNDLGIRGVSSQPTPSSWLKTLADRAAQGQDFPYNLLSGGD